jgi:tRNA G10  N-methylase Trm11
MSTRTDRGAPKPPEPNNPHGETVHPSAALDWSDEQWIAEIHHEEKRLDQKLGHKLSVNYDLDRTLVSFQANKSEAKHRWCKYKEGFSASLVRYILDKLDLRRGTILDPFAGSGTTLFTASEEGLDSLGIELLPCSAEIIEVRNLVQHCDKNQLAKALRKFSTRCSWESRGKSVPFPHLVITSGAFPPQTEALLCRYLRECEKITDPLVRRVCRFAAMCILETISFTRKDGQYLRWDARAGRRDGKPFDKGFIPDFTTAIVAKLKEIASDLDGGEFLFDSEPAPTGRLELRVGSCLDILPTLPADSFDGLITSPPYCNRYDYTRTYALELALMGVGEEQIRSLRQALLSCTVENRAKMDLDRKSTKPIFEMAQKAFATQPLLVKILAYLERCRLGGTINNTGIPRMVRGYFEELTLTVFECARLLKPGAPFVMVNDNVRYQGIHVPVDLILSDMALQAGFDIDAIWVLPRGKGNSSQQMGAHGRQEIRKCVYVWRRATKHRIPRCSSA